MIPETDQPMWDDEISEKAPTTTQMIFQMI